ncbi:MAG TPA: VanZ family protein [Herpetosiphonaceae bacterium]|nr:VanZ family protein [Herpetosiphonaceae bacterium]
MVRPRVAGWLLGIYTLILVGLAFWDWSPGLPAARVVNLLPLAGIGESLAGGGRAILINLVGNVVAFVPPGLLLPLARRTPALRFTLLGGLALSLGIEVAQWIAGYRVSDIDDLLLNGLGTLCGYGLFRLLTGHPFRSITYAAEHYGE